MPISSTDSSSFRLEWRPSRCGVAAAAVLPLACAGAVAASGLPGGLASVPPEAIVPTLLLLGIGLGAAFAWRAARRPRVDLHLRAGRTLAIGCGDSGPARLTERWPLLVLRRTDGGGAWVFWPDTLSADSRRRCRLWADAIPASVVPHHWMG